MIPAINLKEKLKGKDVLILGKGPSLTENAFRKYRKDKVVIGINQASLKLPVDYAFFIDIEPYLEIQGSLVSRKVKVILPFHPNKRSRFSNRSRQMPENLIELMQINKPLMEINKYGGLYYFYTHIKRGRTLNNVFPPNLVSLSSLLQILAVCGIKTVKTLGVDGGQNYSTTLSGPQKTQLKKGYDKQFPIIKGLAMQNDIVLEKADKVEIPIYIGCQPAQYLAAKVLEYSIFLNTMEDVKIYRLNESITASLATSGRTPFSMQRFFIPSLQNYRGRAIYLDSDMLVFNNIRELFDAHPSERAMSACQVPPGSDRRPQYSVMVIDCEKARWDAHQLCERAQTAYHEVMFDFDFEENKERSLPYIWNSLELYEKDKTGLVHFTDMDRQPWISNVNPLAPLWQKYLNGAVRDGFIDMDEVIKAVEQGLVRPSLLFQVEQDELDPLAVPSRIRNQDKWYTPPHTVQRFTSYNTHFTRASLSLAKRMYHFIKEKR